MPYPQSTGFKTGGTSAQAAFSVAEESNALRKEIFSTLQKLGPRTPDEVAWAMDKSILTIRPRFTEMKRKGLIAKTGMKRSNTSGRKADVYAACITLSS